MGDATDEIRAATGSDAIEPFPVAIERVVERANRPLSWMWRHGFRFIVLLDAVALFATMTLINLARFGTNWPTYPLSHYMIGFSIATAIQLVVNYFAGLYEREPRLGYRPWLPRVAVAMAIGVAVQGVAYVVLDRYLMPRLNLAVLLVLGTVVLTWIRALSRNLNLRRRGPSRVLLVGSTERIATTLEHLSVTEPRAVVVGTSTSTVGLFPRAREVEASDVLLLDLSAFQAVFPEPLAQLERDRIGVHQRVSAHETLLGLRAVRQIAGMPFTPIRAHSMQAHQRRLKRLFDLVIVLAFAPIWVPVLALLAIYVRLRAGSPVLYRQRRLGADATPFMLLKFRTMVVNAEANSGPRLAERDDPRVMRGLGWMRSTRADELPQLWNVLRGEMSLVGPRPERPELVAEIEREVPGYSRRFEVPPGLTGMAQVQGRYETSAENKLGYDLQYLVNWSMALDLQILAQTIWVVVTRRV
jgi:exopolysaccharide biosynthesis polyprenyl glycosylphosphotransferase